MRLPSPLAAVVALALPACGAATASPSALPATGLATITDGVPARETSVYVEVRDVASDVSVRTRVTGPQDIAVTGSAWSCKYKKPIELQPIPNNARSVPYAMKMHTIECSAGEFTAGLTSECPSASSDVSKEVASRHAVTLVSLLALAERNGAKRTTVAIACEP